MSELRGSSIFNGFVQQVGPFPGLTTQVHQKQEGMGRDREREGEREEVREGASERFEFFLPSRCAIQSPPVTQKSRGQRSARCLQCSRHLF